jgi:hypothetical protein
MIRPHSKFKIAVDKKYNKVLKLIQSAGVEETIPVIKRTTSTIDTKMLIQEIDHTMYTESEIPTLNEVSKIQQYNNFNRKHVDHLDDSPYANRTIPNINLDNDLANFLNDDDDDVDYDDF